MRHVIEIFPSNKHNEASTRMAALQQLGYTQVTIKGPASLTINDYTSPGKEKSFKHESVLLLTASM